MATNMRNNVAGECSVEELGQVSCVEGRLLRAERGGVMVFRG